MVILATLEVLAIMEYLANQIILYLLKLLEALVNLVNLVN